MSGADTNYYVKFRRRRQNLTNYKKRLALVKGGCIRLVFRKSNKNVLLQIIEYAPNSDRCLISVSTKDLSKFGWNGKRNKQSAYLAGLLLATRAVKKGIKKVVLDMGIYRITKGNIAFASARGALDGGLEVNFDQSLCPELDLEESSISGAIKKIVGE